MTRYLITSSGQVSLPAAIRRRWKTRAVQIEDRGDHVVMRPLPADPIAALEGSWKHLVRMTTDEARAQARRDEAESEERKLRLYGLDP